MGEGWLGPSVEPRGFEAAAGIAGTAPPGPLPALLGLEAQKLLSLVASVTGGISYSCADLRSTEQTKSVLLDLEATPRQSKG